MTERGSSSDIEAATLPMFYKSPAIVRFAEFGDHGLEESDNYEFAAAAAACPITAPEFVAAACDYPIVFSAGQAPEPLAVLGVKEGANLFSSIWTTEAKAAATTKRRYIPAYVRRYPFITVKAEDRYLLGVDAASPRLARKRGKTNFPLFEKSGQPSSATQSIMTFCRAYQEEAERTAQFCAALASCDLLTASKASFTFGDKATYALNGFQTIDGARLKTLPRATLEKWHGNGWLALIAHQQGSLRHWQALVHLHDALSSYNPKQVSKFQ